MLYCKQVNNTRQEVVRAERSSDYGDSQFSAARGCQALCGPHVSEQHINMNDERRDDEATTSNTEAALRIYQVRQGAGTSCSPEGCWRFGWLCCTLAASYK